MGRVMAGAWGKGGYVDEDIPDMEPRGFTYDWTGYRYRALLTTEYRFPIAYVERGYSTWPFYLKNISGALVHGRRGWRPMITKISTTNIAARAWGRK